MAMLYTHSIGNQLLSTKVVFKMRDSVPSARYSRVCNVLRLRKIWLIPTYRVYRLYDKKKGQMAPFFYFARRARKLRYYGDIIHSFDWKSAVQHNVANILLRSQHVLQPLISKSFPQNL